MLKESQENNVNHKNIYFGEVIAIDNNNNTGQIRVRIEDIDLNISDVDLAPCYPLFNFQFFQILPKIGERVTIHFDRFLSGDKTVNQEKRYWQSVSISQPSKIDYDPFHYTASAHESDGFVNLKSDSNNPQNLGVNPKDNEIAIRGRDNTDILLKKREIVIRAGRHENDNPIIFNEIDPAYIQVKGKITDSDIQKTKYVEELVNVPPKYMIKVIVNVNSLLIKVIEKNNNQIVTQTANQFLTRQQLISEAKKIILNYQNNYPNWELRTIEDELSYLPILYPNNKKLVKTIVDDTSVKDVSIPSMVNIVADKINFLSHKTYQGDLTTPHQVITPNQLDEILNQNERMVKGDTLLAFLNLIRIALNNHKHPYPNMATVQDNIMKKINEYNLETIVNDHLRIG
jgi:hypothetical protein